MLAELAFSASDLAQTRFVVSPMWEVVASYRTLAADTVPDIHRRWAGQVRPRLGVVPPDGWLARLVPATGHLADFLTPPPDGPFPTLADELAAIRASDRDVLRAEVPHLSGLDPERRALLRDDPGTALGQVVAEVERYWEVALGPYWARIRTVLEADVFHRARQVAEHGAAHLLNDLHDGVRWDNDTLRVVRRHCVLNRTGTGAGLVLAPSVFVWSRVLTLASPAGPPQLAYPARGAGTLWERRATASTEAVAAVIGRSRTTLLTELEAPASTTELASRTGLSAPAVSQHLTALRAAGLVSAHRAGRSVLYARTTTADALLTAPA
ncbi:ArsR/SmtB family transcription factor [Actinomadura kijaniata]|uniref:ArsR/SmtB family transcription factor n=1 Tax=Actinomadura kijaniata TaxID=46161 RepID=UPI000B2716D2|nr:DUF5937 family protein [Actinomadura kijaniata]